MAAEIITCPDCDRKLRVPVELAGTLVKCPTCSTVFTARITPEEPPPGQVPVESVPPWDPSRQENQSSRHEPTNNQDERDLEYEEVDDGDEVYRHRRPRRRRSRRGYLQPHRGDTIMTLGILSFFLMPLVLGPMAWIMGSSDLAEMRAGRMDPAGESSTNSGKICGMISTILSVSVIGIVFMFFCLCGFGGMLGGIR